MKIESRIFSNFLGVFLLLAMINLSVAVKIKSLSVPSLYELKENPEPLILDCDYDVGPTETGFVLKWLHNNVGVYQWIPTKKSPIALGSFKGRVDVNYVVNDDKNKKHRSLVILKPQLSDAGNYTCNVQTFEGNNKQSAVVKIIDPEDSIRIKYNYNEENETVKFECNVNGIAPIPEVTLLFNDEVNKDSHIELKSTDGGLYNVELTAQVKRGDIEDASNVVCLVRIPDADYSKKESITYDDPKTATTKNEIVGQLTISKDPQSRTNDENGSVTLTSLHTIIVTALILIFTTSRQ